MEDMHKKNYLATTTSALGSNTFSSCLPVCPSRHHSLLCPAAPPCAQWCEPLALPHSLGPLPSWHPQHPESPPSRSCPEGSERAGRVVLTQRLANRASIINRPRGRRETRAGAASRAKRSAGTGRGDRGAVRSPRTAMEAGEGRGGRPGGAPVGQLGGAAPRGRQVSRVWAFPAPTLPATSCVGWLCSPCGQAEVLRAGLRGDSGWRWRGDRESGAGGPAEGRGTRKSGMDGQTRGAPRWGPRGHTLPAGTKSVAGETELCGVPIAPSPAGLEPGGPRLCPAPPSRRPPSPWRRSRTPSPASCRLECRAGSGDENPSPEPQPRPRRAASRLCHWAALSPGHRASHLPRDPGRLRVLLCYLGAGGQRTKGGTKGGTGTGLWV